MITTNKDGNLVLTFQSNINSETSYGQTSLGDHQSTMELFVPEGTTTEEGGAIIEWDIPSLDTTEHIGVNWVDGELEGYDGVFELPEQAILLLQHYGIKVGDDFR